MAVRKPDSEVGPLGVWLYDTTRLVGLSPEQVAKHVGVSSSHVRKIEGGSLRDPSKRLISDIYDYLREVGESQGKPVEKPPGYLGELPVVSQRDDALVQAIRDNTAMMKKLFEALIARLPEPPPEVLDEIDDEEDVLEQERQTMTPPRSIVPEHPVEGRDTGRLRARSGG